MVVPTTYYPKRLRRLWKLPLKFFKWLPELSRRISRFRNTAEESLADTRGIGRGKWREELPSGR